MIQAPIFIVGCPRSGTSLLRRCLNQHPRLAICGETHFFTLVWKLAGRLGDLRHLQHRERLVRDFLEAVAYFGYFHHPVDVTRLGERLRSEGASYPLFFQVLLQEFARQQGKVRCGEKTPGNALHLSLILRLFPDSQIVHVVRDPRDVVASLKTVPFASEDVVTNALLWKRHVRAAETYRRHTCYLRIHYEDLVRTPAPVFDRVCRFLNEPCFDDWAMSFDSPPAHCSWWRARSFQPIHTARIGRWTSDLTDEQLTLIEWITRREMKAFNYLPSSGAQRPRPAWGPVLRELVQFVLFQSHHVWKRTVAWRLDPEPLRFWIREISNDKRFQKTPRDGSDVTGSPGRLSHADSD